MSTSPDAYRPLALPARTAYTCDKCGKKFFPRFVQSKAASTPGYRVVYGECPYCHRGVSQLVEVVEPPPNSSVKRTKRRPKYVFKA